MAINGLSNVHTYQVGLSNVSDVVMRPSPDLNAVSNPSKSHINEVKDNLFISTVNSKNNRLEAVKIRRLDEFLAVELAHLMKDSALEGVS